jgi:hypothetical protein
LEGRPARARLGAVAAAVEVEDKGEVEIDFFMKN